MTNVDGILLDEQLKISKLKIMFGEWWQHYAPPSEFTRTLYSERNHCPYCGGELGPLNTSSDEGSRPLRGNAHLEHMDPLSQGGEDSIRNVIYVCSTCNLRKGNRLFVDWLSTLPPAMQAVARRIYTEKHGHKPEAFNPGLRQPRKTTPLIALMFGEGALRKIYPRPIVTGPPRAN